MLQRDSDEKITAYCMANDCDLITADAKSYTHFFEAGAKTAWMTKLEEWNDKYIYKIGIIS